MLEEHEPVLPATTFESDHRIASPAYAGGADEGPDLDLARGLVDDDHDWYVEGHERPVHRRDLAALLGG